MNGKVARALRKQLRGQFPARAYRAIKRAYSHGQMKTGSDGVITWDHDPIPQRDSVELNS